MVSSLLSHNLHLQFCCVQAIFALTYLVLKALFLRAIKRDTVSLLTFPFLCHGQFFSVNLSFEISTKLFFFSFLFTCYRCSVDFYLVYVMFLLTVISHFCSLLNNCSAPFAFLSFCSFVEIYPSTISRIILSIVQGGHPNYFSM